MREKLKRREFLKYMAVGSASVILPNFASAGKEVAQKPNIIVILSDDAGYADFGCHGSKQFKTPNIDSIATNGVRFTNGYVSASVCAPTRAGLLTGRYQQRFGFEDNLPDKPIAGDSKEYMGLPEDEVTIAELLQKNQYRTCAIGKWHLGDLKKFHPCNHGFDEYFGHIEGSSHYFKENHRTILRNYEDAGKQDYLTDAFGKEACHFINRNIDRPFFLYLAFNAVHTPMDAKPEQKKLFNPIEDNGRRTLAAMTLALDEAVGNVLNTLRKNKLEKNTLVFFLNDNGGAIGYNHSSNSPLNGKKGTFLEGGIRVPFMMQWEGKLPKGLIYNNPVTSLDIFATSVAIANAKVHDNKKLDGVNLIPYLETQRKDMPHKTLFWRRGAFAAIRDLNWKLIRLPHKPPLLYDLSVDISEQNNLSEKYPDKVRELMKKLFEWETELKHPLWRVVPYWTKFNVENYDANYNLEQPE